MMNVKLFLFRFAELAEQSQIRNLYKTMWQLCAATMSWVRRWVELVVYYMIQNFFILFAENSQILLKSLLFPFS